MQHNRCHLYQAGEARLSAEHDNLFIGYLVGLRELDRESRDLHNLQSGIPKSIQKDPPYRAVKGRENEAEMEQIFSLGK